MKELTLSFSARQEKLSQKAFFASFLLGALYAPLEYYALSLGDQWPFPKGSLVEKFNFYHVFFMAPLFAWVSFLPLFFTSSLKGFFPKIAFFLANFLTAVTVEDAGWFVCRVIYPRLKDPRGGLWIQAEEWTARWGSFPLPGGVGVIPYWYVASAILVFLAYLFVKRRIR